MGETQTRFKDHSDEELRQAGFSNDTDYNDRQELEREKRKREKEAERDHQVRQKEEDRELDEWYQTQKAYEENTRYNEYDTGSKGTSKPNGIEMTTTSGTTSTNRTRPSHTTLRLVHVMFSCSRMFHTLCSNLCSLVLQLQTQPNMYRDIQIKHGIPVDDSTETKRNLPSTAEYGNLYTKVMIILLVVDYLMNLWMGFSFLFGTTFDNDCDHSSKGENKFLFHGIFTFIMSTMGVLFALVDFLYLKVHPLEYKVFVTQGATFLLLKYVSQDIACSAIIWNSMFYYNYWDFVGLISITMCALNIAFFGCNCCSQCCFKMAETWNFLFSFCLCFVPVLALWIMIALEVIDPYYDRDIPIVSWTLDGECIGVFNTEKDWDDLSWGEEICETVEEMEYCADNGILVDYDKWWPDVYALQNGIRCWQAEYQDTTVMNTTNVNDSCVQFEWEWNPYSASCSSLRIPLDICIQQLQTRFPFMDIPPVASIIPEFDAGISDFLMYLGVLLIVPNFMVVCCLSVVHCMDGRCGNDEDKPQPRSIIVRV